MTIGLAVALLLQAAAEGEAEEPREEPTAILGNREHQDALRACTASARGLLPRSARIDVSLTVDEAGAVTAVSVSAPKGMAGVAACLEARVRQWQLPARAEAYSVSLPLILQGGGDR